MKKWKKKRVVAVLLTLLVLLQFPADFGSVAHAAQKKEIRGTISVASNISQQDMQQYLDGFNKKYPGIEVKYQSYSDYDNEVSKQIQGGDYPDVYLFRDRCREHLRQERTAVSVCNHGY